MKAYNRYDIYLFALIVSLAFGGIGGALMIVRVLAILLIPALVKNVRKCKDYVNIYILIFVLFYFFCLFSMLWTPDLQQALKELFYYPVHLVLFLEILVFSRVAKMPLNTISWGWLIGLGATLCIAVWEITTGSHLSLSKFDSQTLNTGGIIIERSFAAVTFGNYNSYVAYICFAFPFLFYFMLHNIKNLKFVILSIVVILTAVVVILVDASRGGFLTIIIMGAILFLKTKRSKYKLFFFLVVIVFVVYYINPNSDTLFLAMNTKSEGRNLYTDQGRFGIWLDGFQVLRDYLFVGSGIGSVAAAMRAVTKTGITITHNIFLELLIQFGVLFFTIFIVYLWNIFKKGMITKNKEIKMIIYMAIIALPVYGIIDSGYLLNPFVYVAFASLTVFAYINKINPNVSHEQQ